MNELCLLYKTDFSRTYSTFSAVISPLWNLNILLYIFRKISSNVLVLFRHKMENVLYQQSPTATTTTKKEVQIPSTGIE